MTFSRGDKIFAKVRGYPPWPAVVVAVADETPNKTKYHVLFYGTGETAICKVEDIFPYHSYKDKLGKTNKRRKGFSQALQEIYEADLRDKNAVTCQPEVQAPALPTSLVSDSKRRKKSSENYPSTVESTECTQHSLVAETPSDESKPTSTQPSDSLEVISRSETMIKVKKIPNDPDVFQIPTKTGKQAVTCISKGSTEQGISTEKCEEINASCLQVLADEPFQNDHKIIELPENVMDKAQSSMEKMQLDNGKCMNSKIIRNSIEGQKGEVDELVISIQKDNFKAPDEIKKGDNIQERKTESLFLQEIKTSKRRQVNIDSHTELSSGSKSQDQCSQYASSPKCPYVFKIKEEKVKYLNMLKDLYRFMQLNKIIRRSVHVAAFDTGATITALDEMIKIPCTKLMLKKSPNIVFNISRLRRYVGNIQKWDLTESEKDKFTEDAAEIRNRAIQIYQKFRNTFGVPEHQSFTSYFKQAVKNFDEITEGWSLHKKLTLPEHLHSSGT